MNDEPSSSSTPFPWGDGYLTPGEPVDCPNTPAISLGHSIFYLKDHGIGVEARHYEQIFRMFKRLHGRDEFGGGVGAGLTIVLKLVNRHGGCVWLDSVGRSMISPRPGHVLVVEDSDEDFETVLDASRLANVINEIRRATSGDECLRHSGANAYHLKPVSHPPHLQILQTIFSYWLTCAILPEIKGGQPL